MYIRHYGSKTITEIKNIEKRAGYWRFFEDRYGVLWIATRRGVLKFDAEKEPFSLYSIDENSTQESRRFVTSFSESGHFPDRLWLSASDGIYMYDTKNRNILKSPFKFRGSNVDEDMFVNCVSEAGKNKLWLGTSNLGLFSYDMDSGQIRNYSFAHYKQDVIQSNRVLCLQPDSTGNIWVGTASGVSILDPKKNKISQVPSRSIRTYSASVEAFMDNLENHSRPLSSILPVGDYVDKSIDFALTNDEFIVISAIGEGLPQWNMVDYGWLETADGKVLWSNKELSETFHAGGSAKNRKKTKYHKSLRGQFAPTVRVSRLS